MGKSYRNFGYRIQSAKYLEIILQLYIQVYPTPTKMENREVRAKMKTFKRLWIPFLLFKFYLKLLLCDLHNKIVL